MDVRAAFLEYEHLVKGLMKTRPIPHWVDPAELESDLRLALWYALEIWDPEKANGGTLEGHLCRHLIWRRLGVLRRHSTYSLDGKRKRLLKAMHWDSIETPLGESGTLEDVLEEVQEGAPDRLERSDLIEQLLSRLPPDQRQDVESYFFEGYNQLEISRKRGVTRAAISFSIRTALKDLRPHARALVAA